MWLSFETTVILSQVVFYVSRTITDSHNSYTYLLSSHFWKIKIIFLSRKVLYYNKIYLVWTWCFPNLMTNNLFKKQKIFSYKNFHLLKYPFKTNFANQIHFQRKTNQYSSQNILWWKSHDISHFFLLVSSNTLYKIFLVYETN